MLDWKKHKLESRLPGDEEIVANREIGARRLVAEYGDRLLGASLALCHDRQAAEDLVFRTFEQVVEKISLYDPKQSFYNWCYTILLNYAGEEEPLVGLASASGSHP